MSLVCQKMFATRENVSGGSPDLVSTCFSPQSHQNSMSAKRLHCVPTPQPHRIIRGGCPVVARTSVRLREISVGYEGGKVKHALSVSVASYFPRYGDNWTSA